MSEFKGTPGPWFVTGSMTRYVEARICGGLIQEVAACGPTAADNGYGQQQEANARLIAAAPELLEALLDLEEAYCDAGPGMTAEKRKFGRAALIATRAAIAKALGQ